MAIPPPAGPFPPPAALPFPPALAAPVAGTVASLPLPPAIPAPGAVPKRTITLAGGGPTIEIYHGDILDFASDAIVMLTDDVNIAAQEPFQLPFPHSMRLDLHQKQSAARRKQRRWHQRTWQDVDRFNVLWGGYPTGLLSEAIVRETTSGLLSSRLTLMVHLPEWQTLMPGAGGARWSYSHLRACVFRVLNRAFQLPPNAAAAAAATPWRFRPTSIAFQLIGSSRYHGYGYEGAADSIVRSILWWYKSVTAAQQVARSGAIPTIYLVIPPAAQEKGGDKDWEKVEEAWDTAWMKYFVTPFPPGPPPGTLPVPIPPVYNEATRAAQDAAQTINLRSGRIAVRRY